MGTSSVYRWDHPLREVKKLHKVTQPGRTRTNSQVESQVLCLCWNLHTGCQVERALVVPAPPPTPLNLDTLGLVWRRPRLEKGMGPGPWPPDCFHSIQTAFPIGEGIQAWWPLLRPHRGVPGPAESGVAHPQGLLNKPSFTCRLDDQPKADVLEDHEVEVSQDSAFSLPSLFPSSSACRAG